jgi:predicted dinucleotide-binding enzyme
MDSQIGVVGAGTIGAGVGRFFAEAGWQVAISGGHGPERVVGVAASPGAGSRGSHR